MAEWSIALDCKSNAFGLRGFKSLPTHMLAKEQLEELYKNGYSAKDIADRLNYSESGIRYLLSKYAIPRRSISEAIYVKNNPNGDPFKIKELETQEDFKLFYISIGLYLGEGDKTSKHNVKLVNSNPYILRIFVKFLREICRVNEAKIRASLNIFDDVKLQNSINFWTNSIGITKKQLTGAIVRKSRGGSYKNKSEYGTLSVYVSNIKLKKIIMDWCNNLISCWYADVV